MTVLIVELNELNFVDVIQYIKIGKLPNFAAMLSEHKLIETVSEQKYEELEPWIQWVTAHTGLTLAEHGVFRLGDIVDRELPQIWEVLEENGLKVGAISPMNAKNRCKNAEFFIPDPWTPTAVTGSALMRALSQAVSQAVNDNAQGRIKVKSAFALALAILFYSRIKNYKYYIKIIKSMIRKNSWSKTIFLDLLLSDIYIKNLRKKNPDFSSIFLNSGAHIQHHYMFNSEVYQGDFSNPQWYLDSKMDPVLEVYELYDRIVGQLRSEFPTARMIVATALHQDPYKNLTFYWRLKDHAGFLERAHIPFDRVEPRMSRDFVVYCSSAEEAIYAQNGLRNIKSAEGTELFEVDNRGDSLFVMLTWADEITEDSEYFVNNERRSNFRDEVVFVAIKNGEHNGVGYLIDTGNGGEEQETEVTLSSLPNRIANAFDLDWSAMRAKYLANNKYGDLNLRKDWRD